ncbi:MAG: methyltransferase domain-containing protein [Anaerolineae bacterium]|nr:methyltransferase domain-containing protein [Anaerolineae bacterium]
MESYVIDLLACPICHGDLAWKIMEGQGERIESADATCEKCQITYPVREGIGLFVRPDSTVEDAWEQAESGIVRYLKNHPDVMAGLLNVPLESLNPADQFFRAMLHEDAGHFATAKLVEQVAMRDMYTPDFIRCSQCQFDYILNELADGTGPIVDLASGRGYLVEQMARNLDRPLIVTDISPRVLRRNQRCFGQAGLAQRMSFLAFDARYTPFKDGVVPVLTSNVGLANIASPEDLLVELYRIVSKGVYAVHHFYPPYDTENLVALAQYHLTDLMTHDSALPLFEKAGWQVEFANRCAGRVLPTPISAILEGTRIDGLPVAETVLEWGVLVVKK